MSLEKANIVWSAKQIKNMVANGKINFDHIVQRSYVWEKTRKSAFIESMIIGYPIPNIFAKRLDDGSGKRNSNIYYIMDGKQRLSTVEEYLSDKFPLINLKPITFYDDENAEECTMNLTGRRFSELPETLQNQLLTVTFNVTYFDNLTKEEERELFKRLNAGKPLSTKSRILASCKDIEGILEIGSHNIFTEMLTNKARSNKNQATMVMKAWCMLNRNIEDISFESRMFNPVIENTEITDVEKNTLFEVFDEFVDIHNILTDRGNKKVAKKIYTETHFVSLIPFVKRGIDNKIDSEMMADWIEEFFGAEDCVSVSDIYNESCNSGLAKNTNIVNRNNALLDSYINFFNAESVSENIVN